MESLGDRMKEYEKQQLHYISSSEPFIVRLDGNSFSKFTKQMKKPFEDLPDNALGHYNTQLPFYGKLLLKMLEGTKYEKIQLLGCIVVLITDEREYHEYRVSKKTINTILDMDMKQYLTKLKK